MLYERKVNDALQISDHVEAFQTRGIIGIIKEVRDAQKRRDHYNALSLACSYFQYIGKQLLGYKLDKKVDLIEIIRKLRSKGLVNKAICDDMDEIRKSARNDLQHNGTAFEFNTRLPRLYEKLTITALECLEYFRRTIRNK